jgi:pyruvate formate lyase activating enzyme
MIDIRGFIETSFLDWDGKVSAVVFVPNCNFLCPFCSNSSLIKRIDSLPPLDPETIDEFLVKRQKFIDGVVITGGEPTLQPELPNYISHIRSLGFKVKLDTNGSNPEMLEKLLEAKQLDYVAMDIKGPLDERYAKIVQAKVDLAVIIKSIRLLLDSGIDYEFRTTVCPAVLSEADIENIACAIKGAKKYVIQQFVPKDTLDPELEKVIPYSREKLMAIAENCRKCVNTIVRGV